MALGHRITHAMDGLVAWHAFENGDASQYDVLLTDINMPSMDGLELVRRVRAMGYRGIVVVTSGRVDTISTDIIRDLSIDDVLAKPFTVADLLAKLAKIIGKR
jgi:CheY-like chemotaxis protein